MVEDVTICLVTFEDSQRYKEVTLKKSGGEGNVGTGISPTYLPFGFTFKECQFI